MAQQQQGAPRPGGRAECLFLEKPTAPQEHQEQLGGLAKAVQPITRGDTGVPLALRTTRLGNSHQALSFSEVHPQKVAFPARRTGCPLKGNTPEMGTPCPLPTCPMWCWEVPGLGVGGGGTVVALTDA